MIPHPELILVIPAAALNERGAFHGFQPPSEVHNIGHYLTSHPDEPAIGRFIARDQAETDEDFLQLIPYCLLVCGADIFVYSRNPKGGEVRLHEKLSVGVGGHIEASDHADNPLMAYLNGAVRELQEEVGLELPIQALGNTIIGMLHDNQTAVGRVHLGVVHVLHIAPGRAASILANAESSMSSPRFAPISELLVEAEFFDALEPWSQWALTALSALMAKPKPWQDPASLERLRMLNLTACEVARSSAELLMQDSGREWTVARENLEVALGALTTMLTGCVTQRDLNEASIADHGREFYANARTTLKHQGFAVASTQAEAEGDAA